MKPLMKTYRPQANAPLLKNSPSVKPVQSHKTLRYIALACASIATIILGLLAYNIIRANVLPTKFLAPTIALLVVLAGLLFLLSLIKKTSKTPKIIAIVLSVIFSGISLFGFLKLEDTLSFLSQNFDNSAAQNVSVYNVIVAKESELAESSDLSTLKVSIYRDLTADSAIILQELSSSLGIRDTHFAFVNTIPELIEAATTDRNHLIAINAGAYESYVADDHADVADKLKILKTVEIKTDAEIVEKTVDVTNTPFVVYISGIDTRTGTLPDRSLSDVNILAVINPLVNKVLLVSVPRDYYVHISGTEEGALNDKLTHAGSAGGIQLSKATLSELLGTDINYYIRVNFNFVQNLVDAVGGITVHSDVDYSFNASYGCTFRPGDNPVNGKCALAFARERYAYASGDRHRGENQEQVISLVADKLTSSTTLLSRYSDILGALSGTFETNFTPEDITSFIRTQFSDMKKWSISSYNLDGTTGGGYTYSYPAQVLSVMYPNEETIATAKQKIADLLAE